MKGFDSPQDVIDWLQAYAASAAVGAALELGLPWLLAAAPMEAGEVSRALGVPRGRCHRWLQVLERTGLLERQPGGWALSAGARRAILDSYGRESWALLAAEERERFPAVLDLAPRLTLPEAAPPTRRAGRRTTCSRWSTIPSGPGSSPGCSMSCTGIWPRRWPETLDVGGAGRLLDLGRRIGGHVPGAAAAQPRPHRGGGRHRDRLRRRAADRRRERPRRQDHLPGRRPRPARCLRIRPGPGVRRRRLLGGRSSPRCGRR